MSVFALTIISLVSVGHSAQTAQAGSFGYLPPAVKPSFVDGLEDFDGNESYVSDLTQDEFGQGALAASNGAVPAAVAVSWKIGSVGTSVGYLVTTPASTIDGHSLSMNCVFSGQAGVRGVLTTEVSAIKPEELTTAAEGRGRWSHFFSHGKWTALRFPAVSHGVVKLEIKGWSAGVQDARMSASLVVSDVGAFTAAREGRKPPQRFVSIMVRGTSLNFPTFYVLEHSSARKAAAGTWENGWKVSFKSSLLGTSEMDFGGQMQVFTQMNSLSHKAISVNRSHFLTANVQPRIAGGFVTWSHLSVFPITPSETVSTKFLQRSNLAMTGKSNLAVTVMTMSEVGTVRQESGSTAMPRALEEHGTQEGHGTQDGHGTQEGHDTSGSGHVSTILAFMEASNQASDEDQQHAVYTWQAVIDQLPEEFSPIYSEVSRHDQSDSDSAFCGPSFTGRATKST